MQTDTEANAVTETDRQGSAWLRPEAQIKGTPGSEQQPPPFHTITLESIIISLNSYQSLTDTHRNGSP